MSSRDQEGLLEQPGGSSGSGFGTGADRTGIESGVGGRAGYEGVDLGATSRSAHAEAGSADFTGTTDVGGQQTGMTNAQDIQVGWDVYGSDGDKIGDVSDIGDNYLLLTKGFLFTKDIYVPFSAVTGTDQDRVYLNVSKDQIENMGWDQAPAADTGYATYDTAATTDATTTTQTATAPQADYVVTEQPVQQAQPSRVADDDTLRVQRHEEELQAQTVQREAGAVRVDKDIVEEQQTLEVPVTREEVHVQSRPVDQPVTDTSEAFQGGTLEVPVREEDVQVRKEARVAEELEIDKRAVQETERVSDTVRKEDVRVEQAGDVDVERRGERR